MKSSTTRAKERPPQAKGQSFLAGWRAPYEDKRDGIEVEGSKEVEIWRRRRSHVGNPAEDSKGVWVGGGGRRRIFPQDERGVLRVH